MEVIDSILMVGAWLHGAFIDEVKIGRIWSERLVLTLVRGCGNLRCDALELARISFFLMPMDTFGLSAGSNDKNNSPPPFDIVFFCNKLLFSITFLLFGLILWWICQGQGSRWPVGSSLAVERIQHQVQCKKWICKGTFLIDEIGNAIIQNEDDLPYVLSVVVASLPFRPDASSRR